MQIIRKIKDEDLISTNFCRLIDYQKKVSKFGVGKTKYNFFRRTEELLVECIIKC